MYSLIERRFFVILISLLIAFAFQACTTTRDYGSVPKEIPLAKHPSAPYTIQSGDLLDIKFPYTETHNAQVLVRPDGGIALQIAGEMRAAGKTPAELADEIKLQVSNRLKNPDVIVKIAQSAQQVFVTGEVENQGPVLFRDDLTPLQAISERGGFKNTANSSKVFIIKLKEDTANIYEMNLAQIASNTLSANDVVFVPKTGVAKANLVIEQYIRNMMPLESFRVTYW